MGREKTAADPGRRRLLRGGLALAGLSLAVAGCGLLPLARSASGGTKVSRIGFLASTSPPPGPQHQAFLQALRDLGYVEGQNVAIEYRWAEDYPERLPGLAADLVKADVEVILAGGGDAAVTAKGATATLPIVFAAASDPVAAGLVASLARPGGNVTGLSVGALALNGKRLELLKQAVPSASRLAVLADMSSPAVAEVRQSQWDETRVAAGTLGLDPRRHDVRSPEEFEGAFSAMAGEGAEALVVLQSPSFSRYRARLADLAAQARLPAMYELRLFTDAGGLMSYGPNILDLYRRAATYVDKIHKGAKPADLPVEQPTRFDFVINLKTAQALGLTIPQSVLMQATDVIQ